MNIKRTTLNEYIIKQFLDGHFPGYNASHNGEWYFSLENNALYGGKILRLKTAMGDSIIQVNKNNVIECAQRIQDTLVDLPNILKREKEIDEYCANNPWTFAGT